MQTVDRFKTCQLLDPFHSVYAVSVEHYSVQRCRESSWRLVRVLNSALHLEMEKSHFPSYSADYICKHSSKSLKKEQRFRPNIGQPRFVVIENGRSTFRS